MPSTWRSSRFGIGLAALEVLLALSLLLFAREAMRGGPWHSHVLVVGARDAESFPRVVVSQLPGYESAESGLREGDLLLRAGEQDLAGASAWKTYAQLYAQAGPDGVVAVTRARDGQRSASHEQLAAPRHVWSYAALALTFAVTALLLLRRAPNSANARSFALASLVWAAAQVEFQGAAPLQTYTYFGVRAALGFAWAPLMILAAMQFPERVWPENRRLPRWPWLFSALGITWIACWTGVPLPTQLALRANPVIGSMAIAAILVVITRNYRLADEAGRRQARWVFLGCYLALAPSLAGTLVGALRPDLAGWWFLSQIALFAIPVSVYIAVTRSNLLDVDRLISSTAAYTFLLFGLGAAALTALPWLAREASARAGVDEIVAELGLTLAVAFAAIRLEPLVRPQVERIFFRERQLLQEGVGRLVGELQSASEPALLLELLGERLDELLRPEFCVIYARSAQAFAPVFSRRCTITPHFEISGRLARELAVRIAAVDLDRDRSLADVLGAAERAALRGLGAAALVPVVRGRELQGFVALGRKSSGDVYTATDLALLGVVSGSVAASLTGFDDAELLASARHLQDQLRQYVPASIANRLAEGRALEAGEREVSVLFADLRGYTSLAEGRNAEEIFRIVSHYTETVTRVVTEHGGTVVEFNGDGMMAVFGAPDPLPQKERRALAAARRIVAEVGALRSPALGVAGGSLAVGVGLATGLAYVGAIRSVDRHIWSAIGNTTNLAARLQALTRDLGARIVIDRETHDAAREEAVDFEPRAGTHVRGLHASHDIYVLAA